MSQLVGLPAADDEGEPDGQAAAGSAGALEGALGAAIDITVPSEDRADQKQ